MGVQMNIRKIEANSLTYRELVQFADIERAGRSTFSNMDTLRRKLEQHETFACFQGEEMAAYLVLDRNHPYCGGSLHIAELRPRYDCFTDEVLHCLLRGVVACCAAPLEPTVSVDVHRRHDLFRSVFRSMGFRESFQISSIDADYAVMAIPTAKLVGKPGTEINFQRWHKEGTAQANSRA